MYPPPGAWNESKELPKINEILALLQIMLTEESKPSTICCFSFENFGNFGPQKCRKSFLSKIEGLTPWFSKTAKICIQSISMITADSLTRI